MLTLVIVITALVMTILAVMVTYCTNSLLRRYRRYKLSRLEIPDLERKALLTIAEIVGDPNINHIPWKELEIQERLGAGAGGVVSKAIWRSQKRKLFGAKLEPRVVAVKSMYQSLDMSEEQTRQFLAEIKILSHLEHPNIVKFLGVSCPNREEIVIVTELMERGSVRDLLTKKGTNLPWPIRLRWAKDAATGVHYLHQRSFIHRDIKVASEQEQEREREREREMHHALTHTALITDLTFAYLLVLVACVYSLVTSLSINIGASRLLILVSVPSNANKPALP
jgi:serine/threonine protein kinase